jgi:hypothetical protein
MNKNNQTPGKKLSRNDMKKLQGGAARLLPCDVDEDCPVSCNVVATRGYYCLSGVCRFFKVCP